MTQQETPAWDEQKRWLHEQMRSEAERAHDKLDDFFNHMNEVAITASHLSLRTAVLINGGAAIALLSFDGHLPPAQAKAVAATLLWFAFGIVSASIAIVLAYFTHYCMAGVAATRIKNYQPPFIVDGPKTAGWVLRKKIAHTLAALAGLSSLALFVIGMFAVRAALLK